MLVADYIAEFLSQQGVTHVYEIIGGMITRLVDAMHRHEKVQLVSVHHEQAAAFAAEAGSRVSGVPGVAMATSGPGATNLLTGIGSCYFDSVPAVFITGQVNLGEQKGHRKIRQLGFQETDIVSMAKPVTKAAWQVTDPMKVGDALKTAFDLAKSGRPGPVLLDIPMDVQKAQIDPPTPGTGVDLALPSPREDEIEDLVSGLKKARRPLIIAGGGIHSARVAPLFRQLADRLQIPVIHTLMAVDALPCEHPLRVGMLGSYGNRWANLAIGEADFLLVIGSRLDIRQTGADVNAFKGDRVIYHIDIDEAEINNRICGCHPIVSHLRPFLTQMIQVLSSEPLPGSRSWIKQVQSLKTQWHDTKEISNTSGINPNVFMHVLSQKSGLASVYTIDVGNHQMWAAQSLELKGHQRFLTSGGMGAMGFSLPAAVGACLANGKPVVSISGDGGIQLNIQELETIVHLKLPVKVVVVNNRSLGMVRQFQQSYFKERYASTLWGYSAPDFNAIASAYGIENISVQDPERLDQAIGKMWADPGSPFLLNVEIDTDVNVYPKIAFGHPMTQMEPFAKPIEMEGT